MDYIPYVRQMVHTDDAEQAQEAKAVAAIQESARAATGRMTRNSLLSAAGRTIGTKPFCRYITLSDTQLAALRDSEFMGFGADERC